MCLPRNPEPPVMMMRWSFQLTDAGLLSGFDMVDGSGLGRSCGLGGMIGV